MAPTGQTVAAVLLALGLVRGPSEAQPSDPAATPDAPVVSAEVAPAAEVDPAIEGEPAPESESESDPVAESDPVTESEAPEEAGAVAEDPTPRATTEDPDPDPDPDIEGDEAWEEEPWDDDDAGWEDDYDPLRDSPEALKAQRRIAGGSVVLGLGAMVSFGGLAMLLSDPCARPAGNSCAPASRNRAALTMALPGLATVAVGSVMLALGIRQRKALRMDANLTASGGGVSFSGRF